MTHRQIRIWANVCYIFKTGITGHTMHGPLILCCQSLADVFALSCTHQNWAHFVACTQCCHAFSILPIQWVLSRAVLRSGNFLVCFCTLHKSDFLSENHFPTSFAHFQVSYCTVHGCLFYMSIPCQNLRITCFLVFCGSSSHILKCHLLHRILLECSQIY